MLKKKVLYHNEMQECHSAQETLINKSRALPKFLTRDSHFYKRVYSSLRGIAILSFLCYTWRIISQSTSRSGNFHGAKATPALNINGVCSQFRKWHRFLVLCACIFLSLLQDFRDRYFVIVRSGNSIFARFITVIIISVMFYRRRSGIGVIAICCARSFFKLSFFDPFAAFPPSSLERSRCISFFAFVNVRITRFSMNMCLGSMRLITITLNIRRIRDSFSIFGVVLLPEKTLC